QLRGPGERDHCIRGSECRSADMLVLRRCAAALAQEIGGRDGPANGHQETQQGALLESLADGLVAAPRVVLDVLLAHLNARPAAVRIGEIGDPPTDAETASHMVDPQPSIEGGGALEKPETADRRA